MEKVFRVVTILVLGVGLVEISLRTILGLGTPVLAVSDRVAGYRLKPNQNLRRFFVNTNIDANGMRSDPFKPSKPRGVFRIMFLGDSLTYGTTQVDQSCIFTSLVRTMLGRSSSARIEVLNASAPAWAIANEIGFATFYGIFESDILVEVINHGDLSQPFAKESNLGDSLQFKKPMTAIGELVVRSARIFLMHSGRQDAGIDTASELSPETKLNLNRLVQMKKLAQSKGARFIVLYLPLRRELALRQRASAPTLLVNWAASTHTTLIDLTSAESKFETHEIVTRDGAHFNALGNKILAEPITKAIEGQLTAGDILWQKAAVTKTTRAQ